MSVIEAVEAIYPQLADAFPATTSRPHGAGTSGAIGL
jgi:hypothetical protein